MEASVSKTISNTAIEKFCVDTGDFHPLHSDLKYCKNNGFRDIVAHGMLVSSYTSMIVGMFLPGENALVFAQNFEYFKPVFAGDTIDVHGEIDKKIKRFNVIEVKFTIKVESEIVSSGVVKVKLRN